MITMKAIGIRELKASLSRYLADVQRGEVILVTDRGRVVAVLRAPGASTATRSPIERAIAQLAAAGALTVGEPDPSVYRPSPVRAAAGTGRALLDAERADGR